MGIKGLLPFLTLSSEKSHLRNFNGCKIGVDTSIWLYRGLSAIKYENYVIRQIELLASYGIKPVLVFDGKPPPVKEGTQSQRARLRETNEKKAAEAFNQGRLEEASRYVRRSRTVNLEMTQHVIKICQDMAIDYIVAPCEADAQLAFLNASGMIDAIITEDSDVLVFGAKKVLFKCQESGDCTQVESQNLNKSTNFSSFSDFRFKTFCILAGCDYMNSINGVGIKGASVFANSVTPSNISVKLLHIAEIIGRSNVEVPPSIVSSFYKAFNTFSHQPVFDPIARKIRPIQPYPEGCDPKTMTYAGEQYDTCMAFKLATGAVHWSDLSTAVSSYDPCNKSSRNSIWMQPGEKENAAVASTFAESEEKHRVKVTYCDTAPSTSADKHEYDSSYKVKPTYKRRQKRKWKRSTKPKPSYCEGLARTLDEILQQSEETEEEQMFDSQETEVSSTVTSVGTAPNNDSYFDDALSNQVEDSHMILSPVSHYQCQLSEHKLVQTTLEVGSEDLWEVSFCFPDYSLLKRKLTMKRYVFVKRRPIKFEESWQWIYHCQCDLDGARYVSSLKDSYNTPIEEVTSLLDYCLHVLCFQGLQPGIDAYYGISPEDTFLKATELNKGSDHLYSVTQSSQVRLMPVLQYEDRIGVLPCALSNDALWSVCCIEHGKSDAPETSIRCSNCASHECCHVKAIKMELCKASSDDDALALFSQALSRPPVMTMRYEKDASTETKVPVFPGNRCSENRKEEFCPDVSGSCSCGNDWSGPEFEANCWIFNPLSVSHCKVFHRPCSSSECPNVKLYDGSDDHILCFGTFGFSYQVLYTYMHSFFTASLTMHHFYQLYVSQLVGCGIEVPSTLTYGNLRLACLTFFRLLDIDASNGFHCPDCGKQPAVVVMDGMCLGMQRTFLRIHPASQPSEVQLSGSSFETRNFVNSRKARTFLRKYCQETLHEDEYAEMMATVSQYQPALKPLLEHLKQTGSTLQCPETLRKFLTSLAQDSPVCALVPPEDDVLHLLTQMGEGLNPKNSPTTHLRLLQHKMPLIFNLLQDMDEVPLYLHPIFTVLSKKAAAPFVNREPHSLALTSSANYTGYFPSLPVLCNRGQYVLDTKPLPKELQLLCEKTPRAKGRKGTLTPGLFLLNCPHGVCYGVEIMANHESPDVPFTILRTTFEKAPKVVVYDNACKLHQYCLNRDPAFFKSTQFVVDRLHWKNHVGCSEAYNISLWPHLRSVNSQAAEQRNATLKPLSKMLSYMNYDNFVLMLRSHIWFRNMLHIANFFPDEFPIEEYKSHFTTLAKIYCKRGSD